MLLGRRSIAALLFNMVSSAAKPDKMDPALRALASAWRSGGVVRWKQETARLPYVVDHRSVGLKLTLRSAAASGKVLKAIARKGGAHRASFDEFLYVTVPAAALAGLSDNKWITAMHLDPAAFAPPPEESPQ